MNRNRKIKRVKTKALAAIILAGLTAAGSMAAYMTDADTAINTANVGKVDTELTETEWNEEQAKDITPNEELAKNPVMNNVGKNSAFTFISVSVPIVNTKLSTDDGAVDADAIDTELFTYGKDGKQGVDAAWQQVGDKVYSSDGSYVTYVYAYANDKGEMTELPAGESTTSLFDYIKMKNATEDTGLEGSQYDVVVKGYSIQTQNILENTTYEGNNNDGKTQMELVWNVVKNQRKVSFGDLSTGDYATATDAIKIQAFIRENGYYQMTNYGRLSGYFTDPADTAAEKEQHIKELAADSGYSEDQLKNGVTIKAAGKDFVAVTL